MKKTERYNEEDVTIYYNEYPKPLYGFFYRQGKCSAFDESCKSALLEIRDKIVDFKPDKRIMHFIGDAERDPTTGPGFKVDGKDYEPSENDVVRFKKKEFVYRNENWQELGDEESPSWISDKENYGWN